MTISRDGYSSSRVGYEIKCIFLDGEDASQKLDLGNGCFGTLIIPAGSDLIGKDLNFNAFPMSNESDDFADVELLSTPITLAEGANHLSADQLVELGAVCRCKLSVDSVVSGDSYLYLLWKS